MDQGDIVRGTRMLWIGGGGGLHSEGLLDLSVS